MPPYPKVFDKPMGKKPISIRVLEEDYEKFMDIPKDIRSKLLRDFIKTTREKFHQGEMANS
ncbi:MAG: hypothetical protein QNJ72_31295 [Pleurocapsa sp. MO_226.B13]|nr:hypothetical protein [Pleurocapsa sp. MO_226.B13]